VSAATPDTHTSEKEHVVIALKIDLNGRTGVLLMDTGYHVASPVVVMQDELHPHTGWFKPGGTQKSHRLYNYTLHPSGRYVLWNVKETRHGVEECESALIYIHQAFQSPIDCTERRNLVYNFKSLLKRDARGNVIAGVYFGLKPIDQGNFSLFYQDDNKQVDLKIPFRDIMDGHLQDRVRQALNRCELQLELTHSNGSLQQLLYQTTCALDDAEFMQQLLDINQRIVVLAENN